MHPDFQGSPTRWPVGYTPDIGRDKRPLIQYRRNAESLLAFIRKRNIARMKRQPDISAPKYELHSFINKLLA